MTYTPEAYIALKEAIASGVHSVNYGDKSVTYRSLSDMKKILADMESELFGKSKNRRKLARTDRGFYKKG
ncbi:hypothetical protein LJB95_00915 [Paludibacteraceae bacterium OttesenSCG-928-F17]|nr:hypothetical protein [Paludibacteraceae bacterium OttesenSCG-928-F17]